MEIVLLEDVKSLGKKGTVVKVNDSYGYDMEIRAIEKGSDDGSVPLNSY